MTQADCALLSDCYRSCLELAAQYQLNSIAFCCISTGEFHFPNETAAEIAVQTVIDYQKSNPGMEVIFNVFKDRDYERLWQCSIPCCQKTYDNETAIRNMTCQQTNMRIPSELIPCCPVCGAPMAMNLRADNTFVEDDGWHLAAQRYETFLQSHRDLSIVYLELGVGGNTPGIIKYPFWRMTTENPKAVYVCVNLGEAVCPKEIEGQAVCINGDIGDVLDQLNCRLSDCRLSNFMQKSK